MCLPLFPVEVLEVSAQVFMGSGYEVCHVKSFFSIPNNQWIMYVYEPGAEDDE